MKKLVVKNLNDLLFQKLKKKKSDDGFADKSWQEWLAFLVKNTKIHDTSDDIVGKSTTLKLEPLWMKNTAKNLSYIIKNGKSVKDLENSEKGKSAIIVGAGPSIWIHKHLELLQKSDFNGIIVATDKMLIPLLEKEIIPEYVVSIDGNPELIPAFYRGSLVRKYASEIKALVCIYVSPNLTKLLKKIGMEIYWFSPTSEKRILLMTASKRNPKGLIALRTGGNTGACAWILSWGILKCNPVALIGFDFGYPEEVKLEATPYYSGALKMLPDKTDVALRVSPSYQTIYNPAFKTRAKIDPAFDHYRRVLLEWIKYDLPPEVELFNSTEGGTLFGDRIKCIPFAEFLERFS